jgi:predicted secreted protein
MAKINGTSMSITVEGTQIDCVVDATLETSRDLFDTSCKDDGGWATNGQGQGSWSVSGNARVDFSSTMGYQELVALLLDRTAIAELVFTSDTVGGLVATGAASIASLSFAAPNEDSATFDFSITGNGALTVTVLT